MKSKYQSSKSVAKNQTVPISVDDPRVAWDKIGQTKARQGAEIEIVGLDNKTLIQGGKGLSTPTGTSGVDKNKKLVEIVIPPANGQDAYSYYGFGAIVPTDPTNVAAEWSGEDLIITFDWDYSNDSNRTVSNFILEMVADGITKRTSFDMFPVNKTQTAQTLTLTKELNAKTFGLFRTQITSIAVLAIDPLYNVSGTVNVASVPTYVLDLPTPTITITSITGGYSVAYTTPTNASYNSIEIVEYESSASTEPTGVTYERVYFGTINPAVIIAINSNARWVKARFHGNSGLTTNFSTAQKVTPTNPVSVDNTPPNDVTQITATWVGDDITIAYKLPAQDAGSRIQIQLTAPNLSVGYFYRFPDGSGRDQTTIITKKDLFDQFGEHYSSFTGLLKSVDAADNKTSGVSFNVSARANPLTGVTPSFTLIALSNAYSATFTLPTGAAYGEVYASHTDWSGNPSESILVYSGPSPAVITDTDYTSVYIMMRYYDDFGNTSNYSLKQTTTPLDPGLITSFENPISFGVDAVIYAGDSYNSGKRVTFKSDGIFAYDSAGSPTTQIVSNASTGTPTFITTQAQIADWNVTDTKIENTLSGIPTKYTGLSATGTYSFWAGSSVTGGNSSAKFTVTPLGAVTAREIYIVGTGDANSKLIDAGGSFYVKHDGSLYATSATITGNITASSGTFSGNVSIGTSGSLYAIGSGGSVNSGIRTVFNKDGVAAYNASGGYAAMLTTPLADGSVFKATAANIGGWSVDENRIYKTGISLKGNIDIDSSNGYITVSNSSIANAMAGINSPATTEDSVFWSGGTSPNSSSNPFRVTAGGKLYATDAEITGKITATSGYIGDSATNHWTITASGISAAGAAKIEMTTAGQITLGNYKIYADTAGFKIYDGTGNIISITDNVDSSGFNRIFLGQAAATGVTERQVEVAKNAEISGSYSNSAQDYRSGGLRNMYTITEGQFLTYPTAFPNAGNGSVLLVYTP